MTAEAPIDPRLSARLMRRAAVAVLVVQSVMMALKLGAWVVTDSVSMMSALIDSVLDVAAAVEAPRWCNTANGSDFLMELELPEAFVPALAAMGHTAKRAEDPFFYGSAKAIEFLPSGNLAGAADHRREAFALGY